MYICQPAYFPAVRRFANYSIGGHQENHLHLHWNLTFQKQIKLQVLSGNCFSLPVWFERDGQLFQCKETVLTRPVHLMTWFSFDIMQIWIDVSVQPLTNEISGSIGHSDPEMLQCFDLNRFWKLWSPIRKRHIQKAFVTITVNDYALDSQ